MFLASCSANHNTAFRNVSIDGTSNALVMDAKQRAVLSSHSLQNSDGTPNTSSVRRFCSEPSPDVFSVIAQSLSGGGSFGQSGDPASIELALNLAFSSAEQGSTIPRTQTVNMLREMMFRTCERFLSGGYDDVELSIQAARDQRIMVSILAIEQLTGAVAPRPVIIAASGSAGAGASGDAIVRVDDARRRRDKARADYQTALASYTAENGTEKTCDAIEGKEESDLSDDQKAKVKPCNDKRAARDKALTEKTEAEAAHQQLSEMARTGNLSAQTSVSNNAPGGIDRADTGAVTAVASAVQAIVAGNFNDSSETLQFCYRMLRQRPVGMAPEEYAKLADRCQGYLGTYIQDQDNKLEALTEISTAAVRQTSVVDIRFDEYWRGNSSSFATPEGRAQQAQRIESLLGRADVGKGLCFRSATTREAAKQCFAALPNRVTTQILAGR